MRPFTTLTAWALAVTLVASNLAWAAQLNQATLQVDRALSAAILSGDWVALKERLAQLPAEQAAIPLYRWLQGLAVCETGAWAEGLKLLDTLPDKQEAITESALELAARYPENAHTHLLAAMALVSAQKDTEALKEVERAISLGAKPASANALHGSILALLGRDSEAQAAYDRALRSDPIRVDALVGRAVARLRRSEIKGAREDLEQAFAIAPGLPAALNVCGVIHHVEGDTSAAIRDFQAAATGSTNVVASHNFVMAMRGLSNTQKVALREEGMHLRTITIALADLQNMNTVTAWASDLMQTQARHTPVIATDVADALSKARSQHVVLQSPIREASSTTGDALLRDLKMLKGSVNIVTLGFPASDSATTGLRQYLNSTLPAERQAQISSLQMLAPTEMTRLTGKTLIAAADLVSLAQSSKEIHLKDVPVAVYTALNKPGVQSTGDVNIFRNAGIDTYVTPWKSSLEITLGLTPRPSYVSPTVGVVGATDATTSHTNLAARDWIVYRDGKQQNITTTLSDLGKSYTAPVKTFFDSQGRLEKAIYPDGSTLRYELDPSGNFAKLADSRLGTTIYQHNDANQLTSVLYPNGHRFSFGYDQSGCLSSIVYPDGEKVSVGYDSQRRAITVKDSAKTMEQVFDPSGRLTQLKTDWGATTNFHYDPAGKLSAITDQHGTALNDLDVRIRYLDNGRLRVTESPFGSQMSRYDADGQLLKVEMGPGLKSFYDRLPDGGLLVTSPLGFSRFDKAGNIQASMTIEGVKDTFEWNPQGRLLQSSSLFTGATQYNWSPAGDRAAITLPTGLDYDLRIDKTGRLESVDAFGRQFRVGYDAMGNANRVLGPAGQTFAELKYHYDDRGRPDRITIPDWGRQGKMVEALTEFGAKNPVPSPEWLKRYDAAWSQASPGSPIKSFDQLARDFERWPEEVMKVQANVFGLTFLMMVARPAAIALDWVSKPTALSFALTGAKEGLKALTDRGIQNLREVGAGDIADMFDRVKKPLEFVEKTSSWSSFGLKLTKAVGSGLEMQPGWRFGNPPALEPSGQYTWIHETFKPNVDLTGAGVEAAKKLFSEFAVKPASKSFFENALNLRTDSGTSTGLLPMSPNVIKPEGGVRFDEKLNVDRRWEQGQAPHWKASVLNAPRRTLAIELVR